MPQYRVLTGLSYPTDPALIRRLAAGERIPFPARQLKRAEPGDVVADLPEMSVPWLLAQNLIEPVEEE